MRVFIPLLSLCSLLAGCTVGPAYQGPPAAAPKAAGGTGFVRAGDVPVTAEAPAARWWTALGDPLLDALVDEALAANPDAKAAEAKLRQARAAFRLERANRLPNANASAIYAHAHLPGVDLGSSSGSEGSGGSAGGGDSTDLNLYNVGFDASWEVDLFGGQRRRMEAARAQAEAAEAGLADTRVSLAAEVVQAYVNLRDRQQRRVLGRQSVKMEEQVIGLARQRLERGTATASQVNDLEAQLERDRADIVAIAVDLDAYRDALATLIGEEPGTLDERLGTAGAVPLPPAAVAIGDPAALLRRRPDIRMAERTLAADTAKIGVAEAARFPRLNFMGVLGIGGTSISALSHLDDIAVIAAPQLSWNILDFGRNKARVTQAEAVRDEAEARYRSTVLGALRDAEGALSRYRYRRNTVAVLARAALLAQKNVAIAEDRYKAGTITLIDLLNAQRDQIAADQNLGIMKASLTGDYVAIQKALGLGWE